jgi:acetyl esterase
MSAREPDLDPQAAAFIREVEAAGVPPIWEMAPAAARALQRNFVARLSGEPEGVARIEDRSVPGPAGPIPVRVYTPAGSGPFGVLVWMHGGGWVIGSIDTADAAARALANRTPCVVVSVGYRLAPESRFPAAFDDGLAATHWVAANAADIGVDAARIAVGGDSSGGNLAAAIALAARESAAPALRFQLLVYPVTDDDFERPSVRRYGSGYLITAEEIRWYWRQYLAASADALNPSACPMRAASLGNLPTALVLQAAYDPLLDAGTAYAQRLRREGVAVETSCYDGMIHGFFTMPGVMDRARAAHAAAATALRRAFS